MELALSTEMLGRIFSGAGKPQIAQGALPKASLKEAIDKVLLNK